MLILVEGYLKKRCANLPLMRRRYCMLAVDDSQPSSSSPKIKVMLRSYKHEEARHASIDSFVSSHVVKCIGEWTGKGNLHTYPNAFVVETLQSKLFHCSADTLEDKVRWTTAIAVYDRLSVGSSCTAAVVHTPASYVRLSDATEPGPVINDETPANPPPLEAQHHVATDTAAPTTSIRRPSARPMSLRNDALFNSKQGRRGNYNDLDIDSGEEDHVDAVHLDSALIHPQPASSPRPSVENDALDDIPFSYVDAPAMSMQYITVPDTATNSNARHVDEEEYLDLNPDMVARFSDMRMMEARGLSHDTSHRPKRQDVSTRRKHRQDDPVQPPPRSKKSLHKKQILDDQDAHLRDKTTKKKKKKKKQPPNDDQLQLPPRPSSTLLPPDAPPPRPPPPSVQLPAIDDF